MTWKLPAFESRKERYTFIAIFLVVLLVEGIIFFYPEVNALMNHMDMTPTGSSVEESQLNLAAKTPKEYYDMFQCSCCGKSIDTGCCGMAKQRKAYVDELLLEGVEGDELVYRMVKEFGFDVLMEPSMEQEIRDYIKSQASDNPAKIEIDEEKYSFGTISQSDGIVSTTFTIKNSGGEDLVIENMDTSCMCTSASLTYNGQESPVFSMSMHGTNPKDFELRIPPGDTAQLNVFYDPMAHGKQKKASMKISRTVTIVSNDPIDFQKKVRIDLTQVR
jgi:hypothetical protein